MNKTINELKDDIKIITMHDRIFWKSYFNLEKEYTDILEKYLKNFQEDYKNGDIMNEEDFEKMEELDEEETEEFLLNKL